MIIAQKLQHENRAEYLLYMFQVEDILRAYGCNEQRIADEYLARFQVDAETMATMRQWYADLCEMMRCEQKMERGHLQICNNVVIGLEDLNEALLGSEKFPYYKQMYYKVLPYVVELRAKHGEASSTPSDSATMAPDGVEKSELMYLFEFLYGIMILRLKQAPISQGTEDTVKNITAFLGQLSEYWKADKEGKLELE